ncbi:MAG TPA: hypothetical protein VE619_09035 [Nitrososphaeraceae archaeon]|nr:hypothetical protein [Nitrososphaeraceae archaeon]
MNKTKIRNIISAKNNNLRRRWLDFRNGHSIYLIFIMTFANFVTIQYKLLIEKVPFLTHSIFSSIWVFAMVFVAVYVPLGMIIGYWHRKNQFSVEQEALFSQNQIGATINLFIIDLIDGKVTEEEKQQMRNYLLKIMKRSPRPPTVSNEGTNKSPPSETKINPEKTQ